MSHIDDILEDKLESPSPYETKDPGEGDLDRLITDDDDDSL